MTFESYAPPRERPPLTSYAAFSAVFNGLSSD
jgi:hypothetical protein